MTCWAFLELASQVKRESEPRLVGGRWSWRRRWRGRERLQRVIMTRWALFELASQAEGERVPPRSHNDSLGVVRAGHTGKGGDLASNEAQSLVGGRSPWRRRCE